MMSKKLLGILFVILVLVLIYRQKGMQPPILPSKKNIDEHVVFESAKKSAHWESNAPAHGTTFAGVPVNVVIDFNSDLTPLSVISITNDGNPSVSSEQDPSTGRAREYGTGVTTIDANKLAMRRKMDMVSPDGTYTVFYKACWSDGSCANGNFQFVIDRRLTDGYTDFRGIRDVTINLVGGAFLPKKVRISKYTRVTWINTDFVEHSINTDAYRAHTYFPKQNSKVLKKGDAYAVVFSLPGEYPYHCGKHAQTMTGSILVE